MIPYLEINIHNNYAPCKLTKSATLNSNTVLSPNSLPAAYFDKRFIEAEPKEWQKKFK